MINRQEAISKFKRFINAISSKDVVAVLPDTDVDGISSGVLVYKGLERIKAKRPDVLQFQHVKNCITDDTLNWFRKKGVTKIIITDQSFDQVPEQIIEAETFADILIIDHHEFYNDVNSKKTTLVKSGMLDPGNGGSQYCAAKMTYDLFSEMTDMSDCKWIAALGILTDNNFETFKGFVKEVLKMHNQKWTKQIFRTDLGKAASILSASGAANPPRFQQAFETLYCAKDIYDIIDSKLKNLQKKVEEAVDYYVKNYKDFAEEYPELDLMFIEVNSSFRIKSPVVTRISIEKLPEETILVYSDANSRGEIKVSARNQSAGKKKGAIRVNRMLEYAVKGLEGAYAGGHDPAAGADIKKEQWDIFKKRVIEYVKRERKKNGLQAL